MILTFEAECRQINLSALARTCLVLDRLATHSTHRSEQYETLGRAPIP